MCEIYSKDSFERFGDDLTELVLSYISFEDCFHYKCVSKQWKRLIFNISVDLVEVLSDVEKLSESELIEGVVETELR